MHRGGPLLDVERLAIPDIVLVTPPRFHDERGFFSETFHAEKWAALGLPTNFVQDNHSLTVKRNVVRGLHFQSPPHEQGKLVRCTRGKVFDVAVDLRVGSPSYGHHVAVELSAESWAQLWVPPGFAHGFCSMTEMCEVLYKVTAPYAPSHDLGIAFDDPGLGIAWPAPVADIMASDKDRRLPRLAALPPVFHYQPAG